MSYLIFCLPFSNFFVCVFFAYDYAKYEAKKQRKNSWRSHPKTLQPKWNETNTISGKIQLTWNTSLVYWRCATFVGQHFFLIQMKFTGAFSSRLFAGWWYCHDASAILKANEKKIAWELLIRVHECVEQAYMLPIRGQSLSQRIAVHVIFIQQSTLIQHFNGLLQTLWT